MGKQNKHELTDHELLQRFYDSHDNEWLGVLLERYTLLLFGVCMKYLKNEEEAKDTVQQIFLKAINELHKYQVSYVKSWLYMIAKNQCLMKLRNKGSIQSEEALNNLVADDEVESRQHQLSQQRVNGLLEQSLFELGEEQRVCVTKFYLDKLSYQQVAEATGYSLLAVKSHIQNGKRNLKLIMEKKLKQLNG